MSHFLRNSGLECEVSRFLLPVKTFKAVPDDFNKTSPVSLIHLLVFFFQTRNWTQYFTFARWCSATALYPQPCISSSPVSGHWGNLSPRYFLLSQDCLLYYSRSFNILVNDFSNLGYVFSYFIITSEFILLPTIIKNVLYSRKC